MSALHYLERPADGRPEGLLVLNHGRSADERDLLPLADILDPRRRLHIVTPQAPLALEGAPGRHWYLVPQVGFPDPDTFAAARDGLAALHDDLWASTGLSPEQTVLGGFSMGAVMSYALGLDPGRPAPAGILALSGFIPTVAGWNPDLDRPGTRVYIAHGSRDGVIDVSFARRAHAMLETSPVTVEYHEFGGAHHIDPRQLPDIAEWIDGTLEPAGT